MKLFVILFEQRSGSSHLVSLLNSHREIRSRGEIFNSNQSRGTWGSDLRVHLPVAPDAGDQLDQRQVYIEGCRYQNPSADQCESLIDDWVRDPDHIVGFKFKYPRQVHLFPEVVARLKALKSELRVIVLRRDNLVRRALSFFNHRVIREQTGRSNFRDGAQNLPAIHLDLDSFVQQVRHLESLRNQFLEWSGSFANILNVDYEDLTSNPNSLVQIQKFVGVERVQKLKSRVVKATSERLDLAISNYNEFLTRMACEGLDNYLQRAA